MPKAAEKATLSLCLVEALDVLWAMHHDLRGLADQAQWAMQDACASLGMSLADAAPEVRERADALARASLGDQTRAAAARLRAIAAKLEEVA